MPDPYRVGARRLYGQLPAHRARRASSATAAWSRPSPRTAGSFRSSSRSAKRAPTGRRIFTGFHSRPVQPAEDGAGAAPVAEDGGGRPAHRRHRARLQQHPDRDHRQSRTARRRCSPIPTSGSSRSEAQGAAQDGAKLAAQLLAFARRQPLNPKPTDVGRHVADSPSSCAARSAKPSSSRSPCRRTRISAVVDGAQLQNAVLNLAINARDAMPRGGQLAIDIAAGRVSTPTTPRCTRRCAPAATC